MNYAACGVDNVLVKVHGDEIPILDGSAAPFSELIRGVGLKEQDKKRVYLKILKRVSVTTWKVGFLIFVRLRKVIKRFH